jgi:ABC-type transport system involved in cytochrome c biogenesis permease subunit
MSKLPFGKKNYQMMIAGVVILLVGFIVMSMDKEAYGFGFLGLTLGPIIVLVGFAIEILAILHTPEQPKENK